MLEQFDRNSETLCLDNSAIGDLTPLLPFLSEFENLRFLYLRNNNITSIPELSDFTSLELLDISGNPPVTNLDRLIAALESAPNLRHLSANLESEEDEDNVIVCLPKLESINEICLDETKTQVPPAPSMSEPIAEIVEMFSGMPRTLQNSTEIASTPQKEASSSRDFDYETAAASIVENASSALALPGTDTTSSEEPALEVVAEHVPAPDVVGTEDSSVPPVPEAAAPSALPNEFAAASSGPLRAFDSCLSHLLQLSSSFHTLPGIDPVTQIRKSQELMGACMRERELLVKRIGGDHSAAEAQTEVALSCVSLQRLLQTHLAESLGADSPALASVLQGMAEMQQNELSGLAGAVRGALLHCRSREAELAEAIEREREERLALLGVSENLEQRSQHAEEQLRLTDSRHEEENLRLIEEIGWLRSENDRLKARIGQLKMGVSRPVSTGGSRRLSSGLAAHLVASPVGGIIRDGGPEPRSPGAAAGIASFHPEEQLRQASTRQYISERVRRTSDRSSQLVKNEQVSSFFTEAPGERVLSLRALRDIITEIYASKDQQDEKCKKARQPRETMEQHLYTFLNHKYGLRTMVLDWADAIIRAIVRYESASNDVAVFARILRSEVDEEFRFIQQKVRQAARELLRAHLRTQHKTDNKPRTEERLHQRVEGFIAEPEWADIVSRMYSQKDTADVTELIRSAAAAEIAAEKEQNEIGGAPREVCELLQRSRRGQTLTRKEVSLVRDERRRRRQRIRFSTFVETLLNFQLSRHERFLARFSEIFRELDEDSDCILDEAQFLELARRTLGAGGTKRTLRKLLAAADPFNAKSVTFSDCVAALFDHIAGAQ